MEPKSSRENGPSEEAVRLLPATGSLVGGISKEKTARITDAMTDLQLGIDGLRSQLSSGCDGKTWRNSLAAFARASSVFLRKTVLGDQNKRETRLLDDSVLGSTGLRFDRLRKIPLDKRRKIEAGFGLDGAIVEFTKLDDHTREPQGVYRFRAAPQGVNLSIEWPLPGAADWTGIPSEGAPWPVRADQLFQSSAGSELDCDGWLGQQVVLFDGKGICLKEMIRTVVNFEGAHSADMSRLAVVEGEEVRRAAKNPAPHILNALSVCGIHYLHLIVIESGLYLYNKLLGETTIKRPHGEIYDIELGVACPPEQADSPRPNGVNFEGTMMVSFSGPPQVVCHKI